MIIYNETVKIDLDIHDLWLKWIKEEYAQRIMETGCFTDKKIYRVLQEDESDGITYAMQFFAESIGDYFNYKKNFAEEIQRQGHALFPGKHTVFITILKEI